MGLGAFQLLDAPSAQLEIQSFQCPQPRWIRGATVNVALAARVGTHTVVIVGDELLLFDGTSPAPVLAIGKDDAGSHDYNVQSAVGTLRVRRTFSRRNRHRRALLPRPTDQLRWMSSTCCWCV